MIKQTAQQIINNHGGKIDLGSVGVVISTFFGWLPDIAALFTVIWCILRVYETKTVQDLITKLRKHDEQGSTEEESD